ncbi:MAG: DUF1778 domain-containing protein [Blastococcus sp.]
MATYGRRATPPAPGRIGVSAGRRTLQARVTPEQHAKAHRAAELLGVSVSAFLADLIEHLEVDETGRPSWESRYAPEAMPQLDLSA